MTGRLPVCSRGRRSPRFAHQSSPRFNSGGPSSNRSRAPSRTGPLQPAPSPLPRSCVATWRDLPQCSPFQACRPSRIAQRTIPCRPAHATAAERSELVGAANEESTTARARLSSVHLSTRGGCSLRSLVQSESGEAARACTGNQVGTTVGIPTGVKLRGPEGAQRLRATSASTAELCSILRRDNHVHLAVEHMKKTH